MDIISFPATVSNLNYSQLVLSQDFKKKLDEKNLDLEKLNQEANKLVANCEDDEKGHVMEPLAEVNQNWKDLTEKAQERQVMKKPLTSTFTSSFVCAVCSK